MICHSPVEYYYSEFNSHCSKFLLQVLSAGNEETWACRCPRTSGMCCRSLCALMKAWVRLSGCNLTSAVICLQLTWIKSLSVSRGHPEGPDASWEPRGSGAAGWARRRSLTGQPRGESRATVPHAHAWRQYRYGHASFRSAPEASRYEFAKTVMRDTALCKSLEPVLIFSCYVGKWMQWFTGTRANIHSIQYIRQ